MTARIEEGEKEKQKDTALRESIRKEVRAEIRHNMFASKIRGCLGCLILVFIVFVILLGIISYAASRTGLVEVPIFSRFYQEPQPSRYVKAAEGSLVEAVEKQLMRQAGAKAKGEPIKIMIREEELTGGLMELAATSTAPKIEMIQAVINEEDIELFARIELEGKKSTVMVQVKPEIKDEKITLEVKKVLIGELPIWRRLVNFLVDTKLESQLAGLTEQMKGTLKLQTVELRLRPGTIEVTGK